MNACRLSAVAGTEPDALWSTQNVAHYLGVPAATVRVLGWMGVGPKTIGCYRRFKPSDGRVATLSKLTELTSFQALKASYRLVSQGNAPPQRPS
jgi:hypothetical protein